MTCFPENLQDTDNGQLFSGTEKEERFRKIIKRLLHGHEGDLDGYEVEDICNHSIRKGATTYASSCSTASSSSEAINNQGGWTITI